MPLVYRSPKILSSLQIVNNVIEERHIKDNQISLAKLNPLVVSIIFEGGV